MEGDAKISTPYDKSCSFSGIKDSSQLNIARDNQISKSKIEDFVKAVYDATENFYVLNSVEPLHKTKQSLSVLNSLEQNDDIETKENEEVSAHKALVSIVEEDDISGQIEEQFLNTMAKKGKKPMVDEDGLINAHPRKNRRRKDHSNTDRTIVTRSVGVPKSEPLKVPQEMARIDVSNKELVGDYQDKPRINTSSTVLYYFSPLYNEQDIHRWNEHMDKQHEIAQQELQQGKIQVEEYLDIKRLIFNERLKMNNKPA